MLTGCSDYLDGSEQNRSNINVNNITAEQFSTYAFKQMQTIFDGSTVQELLVKGTDIYINEARKTSVYNTYTFTPGDSKVKSLYQTLYLVINNCNAALEKSPNDQVKADATFMRGLAYYLLTQQFGRVPYSTTYISNSSRNYPRTDLKTIYDSEISGLTEIYNNSSIADVNHEGRASKAAIAALIAKMNLAAGWDLETTVTNEKAGNFTVNSTTYFGEAESWATKVINTSGLSLCGTYEDKWSPKNEGNSEEIFSIQYSRATAVSESTTTTSGNSWQYGFSGYYQTAEKYYQKNGDHQDNPTKKMLNLYSVGDERFDATFMTSMYGAGESPNWPKTGYYAYYNASKEEKADIGIKYKFYSPATTDDEILADFNANGDLYRKAAKDGGVNGTKAQTILMKMGDNVEQYKIEATTTSLPSKTSSNYKSVAYYTDENTNNYSGYLSASSFDGTSEGIMCKKWDDPETDVHTSSKAGFRNIPVFTLSDIYLVRAEAKMMQNSSSDASCSDESYIDDIKAVRNRAKATSYSSLSDYQQSDVAAKIYEDPSKIRPIDFILDERALELFGEYTRWEDIHRTRQLVNYYLTFNNDGAAGAGSIASTSGVYRTYRPIPDTELTNNTGMTLSDGSLDQNPGW